MAERIVAAVRLSRKVGEGVEMQEDLITIMQKWVRKVIFLKPGPETERLKRELVDTVTKKYFDLADVSGRKSAVPVLQGIGGAEAVEAASTLSGAPLRALSGYRRRNVTWFTQEVNTNTTALSSELKAELARASRDQISRARLVTDVTESYDAELKQIKRARKRLAQANKDLANAEATQNKRLIKVARDERIKAMQATRRVETAMGRLENRVQGAARDAVRREQQQAQLASYRQAGFTVFTWVSVNGSAGCPDCISLHGETHKLADWHGRSPGDGQTVCQDSCMCQLTPEQFVVSNDTLATPINPFLFDSFND